jgi:hypothetical protein
LAINFFWCHHQKFKIGIYLSPQVLSNVSAEKIGHHFFWCHHWKFKISIYLSPSLVKYLNRKKQPNRNFNISAQRTLIGKYKLNTHDYLKLNKAKIKVISKLCYNITYQSKEWKQWARQDKARRNQIPKQLRFCKILIFYLKHKAVLRR